MTKKKNPFARDDLLTLCTKFYDSKTRKNRYGNYCDLCKDEIDGTCKRAVWGIDQFGRTNYTIVHHECFVKSLPKEIEKAKEHEKQRRIDFKKSLDDVKKIFKESVQNDN